MPTPGPGDVDARSQPIKPVALSRAPGYNPAMAFTSVQKIRFDDVDGAGIVYYPQFFHLCHAAFEDFFDTAAPISYPQLIRDRRLGFPTVAIESQFTAPLEYGDVAVVELAVQNVGTSSAVLVYTIRRKRDGMPSFKATITTVLMDLDSRRPIPIPDELRALLEGHLSSSSPGSP